MDSTTQRRILAYVNELELKTRIGMTALTTGNYRSTFRGSGMQFKDFRAYAAGDDIRHMSWVVTARTGKPTLKTFEEDRELNIVFIVDTSGSSLMNSAGINLLNMYAELVMLIGYAAAKEHDKIAFLYADSSVLDWIPFRSGRSHARLAVEKLLSRQIRNQRSDLRPALTRAMYSVRKRSLVFILSDFIVPNFETELLQISKRHEIIMLHAASDFWRGILPPAIIELCDPETGEYFLLDGCSRQVRSQLAQKYVENQNALQDIAHKAKADYLTLNQQDDYLRRLVNFFKQRGSARV